MGRFPFPSLPSGWYGVALSDELGAGTILSRHYFDREIIAYRGADGMARVADAFCPHMGGHLGRLGVLEGDRLRCRFHGFQYDGHGRCVATAYGGPPPVRARLRLWEVREQNGLVLTWFGAAGEPPDWEVPVFDESGFGRLHGYRFDIASHPQETTENSVDFGHFTQLHGFVDGSITRPIQVEGPFLTTAYRAYRPLPAPRLPLFKLPVDYAVTVLGLGYSLVEVRIEPLRFEMRLFVLPVPRDDEHLDLLMATSARKRLGPLSDLTRRFAHDIVRREIGEDLDVWRYKTYLEQPALAKGDGPVAVYRRYVRQFYPSLADEGDRQVVEEAVAAVGADGGPEA